MSNQIGNYVHYYGRSYAKYGINRIGEKDLYDVTQWVINRQENMRKKLAIDINDDDLEEIQKIIQEYYTPTATPTSYDNKYQEDVKKWVADSLYDKFYKNNKFIKKTLAHELERYYQEGKVQDSLYGVGKLNVNKNAWQTGKDNDLLHTIPEQINKKIEQLQKVLDNLNKDSTIDPSEYRGLRAKIKDLRKRLKQLYNKAEQASKQKKAKGDFIEKRNGKEVRGVLASDSDSLRELINNINDIIQKYTIIKPATSLVQGTAFEDIIAAALFPVGCNQINATFKNMQADIEKAAEVGQHGSYAVINSVHFDSDFVNFKERLGNNEFKINNDSQITVNSSQDKIDVIVQWNNYKGTQIELPISAKNYASDNDIAAVTGTSLLFLLQDEQPEIINHYLNLAGAHYHKGIVDSKKIVMEKALQLVLLEKALAGSTSKITSEGVLAKQAKLLILNSRGKIYVKKISDIVDNIVDNNFTAMVMEPKLNTLFSLQKYNEWIEKDGIKAANPDLARERITNYLMKIHSMKMSIHVKQTAIIQ